jgi:hypothetical protein
LKLLAEIKYNAIACNDHLLRKVFPLVWETILPILAPALSIFGLAGLEAIVVLTTKQRAELAISILVLSDVTDPLNWQQHY